jgi:hypothetical protein
VHTNQLKQTVRGVWHDMVAAFSKEPTGPDHLRPVASTGKNLNSSAYYRLMHVFLDADVTAVLLTLVFRAKEHDTAGERTQDTIYKTINSERSCFHSRYKRKLPYNSSAQLFRAGAEQSAPTLRFTSCNPFSSPQSKLQNKRASETPFD